MDLGGLYQLNLHQRVRRLDIVTRDCGSHSLDWISAILTATEPTHLQLHFEEGSMKIVQNYGSILKQAHRVTYLRLADATKTSLDLDRICEALRSTQVKHLELNGLNSTSLDMATQVGKSVPVLGFLTMTGWNSSASYSISRECMPGEVIVQMLDDDVAKATSDAVWG
ncbi:hypothetical protein CERSUDRAFT_127761 [Gelatoporia subvermispora B]|nr:hypothetical protein CERSUDRAFT_127761 [Gelatoporia subvermispora B]